MVDKKAKKKVPEVKTVDQLKQELISLASELNQAKLGNAAGELTNPHRITVIRKNIARVHSAIWTASQKAEKENVNV